MAAGAGEEKDADGEGYEEFDYDPDEELSVFTTSISTDDHSYNTKRVATRGSSRRRSSKIAAERKGLQPD